MHIVLQVDNWNKKDIHFIVALSLEPTFIPKLQV